MVRAACFTAHEKRGVSQFLVSSGTGSLGNYQSIKGKTPLIVLCKHTLTAKGIAQAHKRCEISRMEALENDSATMAPGTEQHTEHAQRIQAAGARVAEAFSGRVRMKLEELRVLQDLAVVCESSL